jgi:hypothetical protein
MGIDYVALSRATSISQIFLLSPLREHHFNSHMPTRFQIASEYRRLRGLLSKMEYDEIKPYIVEPPGYG